MYSSGPLHIGGLAITYTQQLCADTECIPEDLPEAMDDKEGWRERIRDMHAADEMHHIISGIILWFSFSSSSTSFNFELKWLEKYWNTKYVVQLLRLNLSIGDTVELNNIYFDCIMLQVK